MSGPKMCTNIRKMLPNRNFNRPTGCNILATSLDHMALLKATLIGNRATRRVAIRNMLKQARAWANTPAGKKELAANKETK